MITGLCKLGLVIIPETLKLGIVIIHGTQEWSLYVEFPATVLDSTAWIDLEFSDDDENNSNDDKCYNFYTEYLKYHFIPIVMHDGGE